MNIVKMLLAKTKKNSVCKNKQWPPKYLVERLHFQFLAFVTKTAHLIESHLSTEKT